MSEPTAPPRLFAPDVEGLRELRVILGVGARPKELPEVPMRSTSSRVASNFLRSACCRATRRSAPCNRTPGSKSCAAGLLANKESVWKALAAAMKKLSPPPPPHSTVSKSLAQGASQTSSPSEPA